DQTQLALNCDPEHFVNGQTSVGVRSRRQDSRPVGFSEYGFGFAFGEGRKFSVHVANGVGFGSDLSER
ncbi:MAG: hypothetical protein ACXVBB_17440, partial [Isosphaeraceae bacterium]